jgi:hypothetical protein
MSHNKVDESETKCYVPSFLSGSQQENNDEPNPIDLIAEELEADRIHLDSLRLDKRMNAKDYEFITRLPLSAKQLINILYELYPVNTTKKDEPQLVDQTVSING